MKRDSVNDLCVPKYFLLMMIPFQVQNWSIVPYEAHQGLSEFCFGYISTQKYPSFLSRLIIWVFSVGRLKNAKGLDDWKLRYSQNKILLGLECVAPPFILINLNENCRTIRLFDRTPTLLENISSVNLHNL